MVGYVVVPDKPCVCESDCRCSHTPNSFYAPQNIMTVADRDRLLAEFDHRNAARQRVLDSMTEALAESHRQRRIAVDAKGKSEGLLINATHRRRHLERENLALMEQIKYLSEELITSRAQMEELLQSAQLEQHAAWEERERKYKLIIREMKEHIRKKENVVPVSLYRTAVAEAKQHAGESKIHKQITASLQVKVAELERAMEAKNLGIEQNVTQTIAEKQKENQPPPPPSKRSHVTFVEKQQGPYLETVRVPTEPSPAVATVHNKASAMKPASEVRPALKNANGNVSSATVPAKLTTKPALKNANIPAKDAKTPTTPSNNASRTPRLPKQHTTPPAAGSKTPSRLEFTCSPVKGSEGRSRIRVSMVRAAGGRIGLQKKLREMRSPILIKKCNTEVGLENYHKKIEQMHIRPRPRPGN
jgi:hypothetical protein